MSDANSANRSPAITFALRAYVVLTYLFIFAPIAASFVFSFNADRFPSIPLGGFSLEWYRAVASDPLVWEGLRNTLVVGVAAKKLGLIALALGFFAKFAKIILLGLALLGGGALKLFKRKPTSTPNA